MVNAGPPVVVIGGGSAGLTTSFELSANGIEHVVLERGRTGQRWRDRWDSFCLVTPNWTMDLPGMAYDGPDPDGFMPRDEIVERLERYAVQIQAPLRQGVEVSSLEAGTRGFRLATNDGAIEAEAVVVATGAFQRPHLPTANLNLPTELCVLDVDGYRMPEALPPGAVLVVGSGQTGCQLAEELHESGRDVFLSCGRAPWTPRRLGGRDVYDWVVETGFLETRLSDLPSQAARLTGNAQATGHRGGHDLHYRTLQAMGVALLGRFLGVDGRRAHFASDLAESVAFGDARYSDICELVRKHCLASGKPVPEMGPPAPFVADPPESIAAGELGAVIFTSGFRPDYARWIRFPAFDEMGFPLQEDGASTVIPGLYFVGVHFLRKRKSSLLIGVGEDAAVVAKTIAAPVMQRPHRGLP